jgi:hypothetical protein
VALHFQISIYKIGFRGLRHDARDQGGSVISRVQDRKKWSASLDYVFGIQNARRSRTGHCGIR